jgi:hypothetical protein
MDPLIPDGKIEGNTPEGIGLAPPLWQVRAPIAIGKKSTRTDDTWFTDGRTDGKIEGRGWKKDPM